MSKKKEVRPVTQTDILVCAIEYMAERCKKYDEMYKSCKDPEMKAQLADNEFFFRFKKMLQLYEIQTGHEYNCEFDFEFLKE